MNVYEPLPSEKIKRKKITKQNIMVVNVGKFEKKKFPKLNQTIS